MNRTVFMGWILWAVAALLGTSATLAHDKPLPFSGQYAFNGNVEEVQRIHQPVIWGGHSAGREDIRGFRKKGYTCAKKYRQWYKCRKFLSPLTPENIKDEIAERVAAAGVVEFGDHRGTDLEVDGELYKMWKVSQPIAYGGHSFEEYRYMKTSQVTKIEAGDFSRGTGISFVVTEQGLRQVQIVRRDEFSYMNFADFMAIEDL